MHLCFILSFAIFEFRLRIWSPVPQICVPPVLLIYPREVTALDPEGGFWQLVHIHSKCCFTKDLRSSSTDLIVKSSQSWEPSRPSPAPSNYHCPVFLQQNPQHCFSARLAFRTSSGDPTKHWYFFGRTEVMLYVIQVKYWHLLILLWTLHTQVCKIT